MVSACCGITLAARPDYDKPNCDVSKIAPCPLEDPLPFTNGEKMVSPADWTRRCRETLGAFSKQMFGEVPPKPERVSPRN